MSNVCTVRSGFGPANARIARSTSRESFQEPHRFSWICFPWTDRSLVRWGPSVTAALNSLGRLRSVPLVWESSRYMPQTSSFWLNWDASKGSVVPSWLITTTWSCWSKKTIASIFESKDSQVEAISGVCISNIWAPTSSNTRIGGDWLNMHSKMSRLDNNRSAASRQK